MMYSIRHDSINLHIPPLLRLLFLSTLVTALVRQNAQEYTTPAPPLEHLS